MRKINPIPVKKVFIPQKKKVAAYARVSRDTEQLMHSAFAQVSYYRSLIKNNPEWEFAGVYADYGITGRKISVREEFKQMIKDCEEGKIDIILTKSISRFARNTLDLLNTVRHLKDLGIEVRFDEQNISSLSGDGELLLSILASFAQAESCSISENTKWGLRKRFQSGDIGCSNKHLIGYRYDEKLKKYIIIPEEAELIRKIYKMYIYGIALGDIASILNSSGYRSANGCQFNGTAIYRLIFNDVYIGIIRRQKSYIPDPILGKKIKNKGELPQYIIEDAHEAIIDKETYEKVLKEQKRRYTLGTHIYRMYPFTGMIYCGRCGEKYLRAVNSSLKVPKPRWICKSKYSRATNCGNHIYTEEELEKITAAVLGTDGFDADIFTATVEQMEVKSNGDIEFSYVNGKRKQWKKLYPTGLHHGYVMTVTDCFKDKLICSICGNPYLRKIDNGKKCCTWYCPSRVNKRKTCANDNIRDYDLRQISTYMMGIDEFTEETFNANIDKIKIISRDHLIFIFKDGSIKDWYENRTNVIDVDEGRCE